MKLTWETSWQDHRRRLINHPGYHCHPLSALMGVTPKSERTKAGPTIHDALSLGHLSAATAARAATDGGSLTSVGYQAAAVVCPKGSGEPAYEVIDLAELSRYRPYAPGAPEIRAEAK